MDLKKIKDHRKQQGLSVLEISRRSGVSPDQVTKMEQGLGNSSYSSVRRVMFALGYVDVWVIKESL